jgi:DNA-binding CsgD family transcriptional regulator
MAYRSLNPASCADLVGHIYEAALDPARWRDVVDALEGFYPDSRVTLFAHRDGRLVAGMAINKNFPDDALRAYSAYYATNSPFVARAKSLAVGRAVYSEQQVSPSELVTTELYNDFMRPSRLGHYATGVLVERDERGMIALSIADHKDDKHRRAHQLDLLGVIAPHLTRAARLHRATTARATAANAVEAAFDRWAHAAFVADADGRIITMNQAASALLARDDGLSLDRHGHLLGCDDKAGRALDALIRRCVLLTDRCALASGDTDRDGIALPRRGGTVPLSAIAWPLPYVDAHPEFGAPHGRALIIVFDPEQVPRTPVGWLARRFGLSAAERALTEAIVNGTTLSDAADQLGIRISTARTRLKAIQNKTGCSRQAELVRLALAMPVLRLS